MLSEDEHCVVRFLLTPRVLLREQIDNTVEHGERLGERSGLLAVMLGSLLLGLFDDFIDVLASAPADVFALERTFKRRHVVGVLVAEGLLGQKVVKLSAP